MEHDTQRKTIAMKQDQNQRAASSRPRELAEPGYWLVAALEWPSGSRITEAAFVVAPEMIPRDKLSNDAYQVLGCADLCAGEHAAASCSSPT